MIAGAYTVFHELFVGCGLLFLLVCFLMRWQRRISRLKRGVGNLGRLEQTLHEMFPDGQRRP